MADQPTYRDADLILRLYDLRREAEMRKARNFIVGEFWPRTWEEFSAVATGFGSQPNAYLRQVLSYWDMACSLVNTGVLNAQLFFQPSASGEMYSLYARLKPFLKQARETFSPEFMLNMERVIESTPESRERLRIIEQNIGRWMQMREQRETAAGH
jgi:hypothetical protein